MSDTLEVKTIAELRKFARNEGIKGCSKYTRKQSLIQYITITMKNRGTSSLAQENRIVDDSEENEEGECELDGRLDASKKNKVREKLFWKCLKGIPVTDEELRKSFACRPDQIQGIVEKVLSEYSDLRDSVVHIGGQANNYDYTFQQGDASLNIELKTNTSSTKYETLVQTPWIGYGQLIQIFLNVKNTKYNNLLRSFDTEGMIRSWFDTVILEKIIPTCHIQGEISYESYYTMLFKSSKEAAKKYNDTSIPIGTRNLFKYFHENRTKSDNTYRANLWKEFSREWMKAHRFDDASALELLQETLQKKHIWICTTKKDAYIIKVPVCKAMQFDTTKSSKDATVLIYKTTFVEQSGKEYIVDIEFRIYWKNGGHGVHNLCLRVC